jgi:hypothetical protein
MKLLRLAVLLFVLQVVLGCVMVQVGSRELPAVQVEIRPELGRFTTTQPAGDLFTPEQEAALEALLRDG